MASANLEASGFLGEDGKAQDEVSGAGEESSRADERISVSFDFRQRRKDIEPAAASANEVVRADLLAR